MPINSTGKTDVSFYEMWSDDYIFYSRQILDRF